MKTSKQVEDDIEDIITELCDVAVSWDNFLPLCKLAISLETCLRAWELVRYVESENTTGSAEGK